MDIFLCCLRLLSVLKLEEHSLHLKSWSRWSLLCSCRLRFAEKFLPQTLQIKASREGKILPCISLLWSSGLLWELNFEKHIRHVNFPIKWPFLCLVRFFFIVNDFPHSSQTQEAMFQHEQWRQTDEITSCFNCLTLTSIVSADHLASVQPEVHVTDVRMRVVIPGLRHQDKI